MEKNTEKLNSHEIISYFNNLYEMGTLIEYPDSVRSAIDNLKKSQKKNGLDYILENWEDGLKKLKFEEEVIKKLRKSLNTVLLNLDTVERMSSFIPESFKKEILGFISSCVGLYSIKEYNIKEKNKLQNLRELLPFTKDGQFKDLEWFMKNKNIEVVFENTGDIYKNDSGASLSIGMILKKLEDNNYNSETWQKIWQECFFRRVQWKLWNKLQEKEFFTAKQIVKSLDIFESVIKNLEKANSHEEGIEILFNTVILELNLNGTNIEKKINHVKIIILNCMSFIESINKKTVLKTLQALPSLDDIRSAISIEKLKKSKSHLILMELHEKYNELKKNYDLKSHKGLLKKIKKYINEKDIYMSSYVTYFFNDSQALIDNQIASLREVKKTKTKIKNLDNLKASLEKLRPYKVEENLWNGKDIEYIDYLARLCFIIVVEENKVYILNPSIMINIFENFIDQEEKKQIGNKFLSLEEIFKRSFLPQLEVNQ